MKHFIPKLTSFLKYLLIICVLFTLLELVFVNDGFSQNVEECSYSKVAKIHVDHGKYCPAEYVVCSFERYILSKDVAIPLGTDHCSAKVVSSDYTLYYVVKDGSFYEQEFKIGDFDPNNTFAFRFVDYIPPIYLDRKHRISLIAKGTYGYNIYGCDNKKTGSGTFYDSYETSIDLLPAPPTATTITADYSCAETEGNVYIKGISSLVQPLSYNWIIVPRSIPTYFRLTELNKYEKLDELNYKWESSNIDSINTKKRPGTLFKLLLMYSDSSITGCISEKNLSVGAYKPLKINPIQNDTICTEGTGKLHVKITDGAGGYVTTYKFDAAQNVLGTIDSLKEFLIDSLNSGEYEITVKDKCMDTTFRPTIILPPAFSFEITDTIQPTCANKPNGKIVIAIDDKEKTEEQFSYSINPQYTALEDGRILSFEGLPAGTYTINVWNTKYTECKKQITVKLTLDTLKVTPTLTNVDCYGYSTGQVVLKASGGAKNKYSVTWGESTTIIDSVLTIKDLKAGTYSYTIKNNNSCEDILTKSVTVNENPKINIYAHYTPIICKGEPTTFTLDSVRGGTGIYNPEVWYGQNPNGNWNPVASVTNVTGQNYRVEITDSKSCVMTQEYLVANKSAGLTIDSVSINNIKCLSETGSLLVHASQGAPPYTFFSSKDAATFSSVTNLPADDYYVKVVDKFGCQYTTPSTFKITAPTEALGLAITTSNYNGFGIQCKGNASGSITLSASGGNGKKPDGGDYTNYTFSVNGGAFSPANKINGLKAQTGTVIVQDERGCQLTKSFELTEPPKLQLSLDSVVGVKCYNQPEGKIYLKATGGVGSAYNFELNNGSANNTGVFTDLLVNTYQATVKDQNLCSATINASITNLYFPVVTTFTTDSVKCYGESTGFIIAKTTGGSEQYNTKWFNLSTGQNIAAGTDTLKNIAAGSYKLELSDKLGCPTITKTVDLGQPDTALVFTTALPKDVVCYGETGKLSLSAKGGNKGYSYQVSTGGNSFVPYTNNGSLAAGIYTLQVIDRKLCKALYKNTVEITKPAAPLDFSYRISNYNGVNIRCHNDSNGRISLIATGGNGNAYQDYSYTFNNSAPSTDSVYTNLMAGIYNISLRDGRGCVVNKNITLSQPSALKLTVQNISKTQCFNDSSGSITLAVSGGTLPFSYKIGEKNFTSSGIFQKLPVGNYQFTIQDTNQCALDTAFSITSTYEKPITQLIPQDISCFGEADGQLKASVEHGSGEFNYALFRKISDSWEFIRNEDHNNVALFTGLLPAEYRLALSDKANCPAIYYQAEVKQTVSKLLLDSVQMQDVKCYGDSGNFTLFASGGTQGYTYQISTNNATFTDYTPNTGLPAGSYYFRVKDSKNCIATGTENLNITQPPTPLDFTWIAEERNGYNISCAGKADGKISISATGGNGGNYTGYTYFSNENKANSSLISELDTSLRSLSVIDARGCVVKKDALLTQPKSDITLIVKNINLPVCHYDTTGIVSLSAKGGTRPYVFSYHKDNVYRNDSVIGNLPVGKYTFWVRDLNECSQKTDTFVSFSDPRIQTTAIIEPVKCFGQNNGQITATASGGSAPFTYWWKELALNSNIAGNLTKGNYTILVKDDAGCTQTDTFTVNEPAAPLQLKLSSEPACDQLTNGKIYALASGGTAPYYFSANDATNLYSDSVLNVPGGWQKVYARDSNFCTTNQQILVELRNTMPYINFIVATSRYESDTLVIKDVSVPAPDSVSWIFPPQAQVFSQNMLEAQVKYLNTGDYLVKMTGRFGTCSYTKEKYIHIAPSDSMLVENTNYQAEIKSITVSPNPNDGNFILKVELGVKQKMLVKIMDIYSKVHYQEYFPEDTKLEKQINLNVMPGMYLIWVTTNTDSRSVWMIKN